MSCQCSVCDRSIDVSADYSDWPKTLDKQPGIYPVTANGKLDGALIGFVCASCLLCANKARSDVKSLLAGVQVSEHAVRQYLKRHTGEPLQTDTAKVSIMRLFRDAKRIVFRHHSYVAKVAPKHGPSLHWFKQGWIFFTTVDIPYTVKTMYFGREFGLLLHREFEFTDA